MNNIYCELCLKTDQDVYYSNILCESLWKLLQLPVSNYQAYVCIRCSYLLKKFYEFYLKCHRAHQLLNNFGLDHSQITKHDVASIDRKFHNLESSLCFKLTETNDYYSQDSIDNPPTEYCVSDDIKIEFLDDIKDYEERKCTVFEENILESCVIEETVRKRKKQKESKDKKSSTKDTVVNDRITIQETDIKEENYGSDGFSDIDDEPLIKLPKSIKKNGAKKKCVKNNLGNPLLKRKGGPEFKASNFEGYAIVEAMTPEEARKEVLLRKESSNYMNCPFKCDLCYRAFDSKDTFENHKIKHSVEFGKWECEICYLRFSEHKHLYTHHSSSHKRKFICVICPYICYNTNQASSHVKVHKGVKYTCNECGDTFSMPNTLSMHKRIKHKAERVCAFCGSTFVSLRGLTSHNLILHRQETLEEKGPNCELCGVIFASEKAYKRHLVLSSKHEVSNGCDICGDTFEDDMTLKTHMRLHNRNQAHQHKTPITCTICDKYIATAEEFKSHMSSQHPNSGAAKKLVAKDKLKCVCEVCGKMFKKPSFLKYHQRVHSGERPYACTICGKRYASSSTFSTHKATHGVTKRKIIHQCHLCPKVLRSRSALNKHVKAHLGIRPHKCDICGKSFQNPCEVKVHIKHVHLKEPWPKRDRNKQMYPEDNKI